MAFPNLSEIVTTTLRNRTGELADNMSRNNAALLRLTRRGNLKTFSGGRTIVQELNYADNQTLNSFSLATLACVSKVGSHLSKTFCDYKFDKGFGHCLS